MKADFITNIEQKFPQLKEEKILLAVSGGVDSMVMCDLFLQKFPSTQLCIAHCNFHLRGKESERDAIFVTEFAKKRNIEFFIKSFDTVFYADSNKVSIQVAARVLRYQWFDELCTQHGIGFIATAHHLDDAAETFLMHAIRGSGLQGFLGIPEIQGKIVRPLLIFSRDAIEQYANETKLDWVEDKTNADSKYFRNKVRHQIMPICKEENPSFLTSFQQTLSNLHQSQSMIEDAVEAFKTKVCAVSAHEMVIDVAQALEYKNVKAYLYEILSPYGFKSWKDVYQLLYATSGKWIATENFLLLKNRNKIHLKSKNTENHSLFYQINKEDMSINQPISLTFEKFDKKNINPTSSHELYLDNDVVQFPLFLRKWKEGDVFYPFGMGGKKKVSKYFKDEKWSLFEKKDAWLLTDAHDQIMWVVGHRADDRYKVNQLTKTILKIKFIS